MPDVVVVGVDGSENGWRALEWATDEAKLRGGSLRIVCSFEDPVSTVGIGSAFGANSSITVDPELIKRWLWSARGGTRRSAAFCSAP